MSPVPFVRHTILISIERKYGCWCCNYFHICLQSGGGGGRKLTHLRPEVIHLNGRRGEAINDRESIITGVIVACDTCLFFHMILNGTEMTG